MPSENIEPDIPKEFTRPEVIAIIKSVIAYHTPDQARELGAEYLLEKFELRATGKTPSFP